MSIVQRTGSIRCIVWLIPTAGARNNVVNINMIDWLLSIRSVLMAVYPQRKRVVRKVTSFEAIQVNMRKRKTRSKYSRYYGYLLGNMDYNQPSI
jgi:hypothetical protein